MPATATTTITIDDSDGDSDNPTTTTTHHTATRWDHLQQVHEFLASIMSWTDLPRDADARDTFPQLVDVAVHAPLAHFGEVLRIDSRRTAHGDVASAAIFVEPSQQLALSYAKRHPRELPPPPHLPHRHAQTTFLTLPSDAPTALASPRFQAVRYLLEAVAGDGLRRPTALRLALLRELPAAPETPLTASVSCNADSSLVILHLHQARLLAWATLRSDPSSPLLPRYSKGVSVPATPHLRAYSARTRGARGPSVTTVSVGAEDLASSASFCVWLLHAADASTGVVFEQLLEDDSAFQTERAEADGARRWICFWRACAAHVVARPRAGERAVLANNWLSRVGRSTWEVSADLFARSDGAHVATVRYTTVVVERLTGKPGRIFFDAHRVAAWYAPYESALREAGAPPARGAAARAPFRHALSVRHFHQDRNGHVNSGQYLALVHDAKDAALAAGYFSADAASLLRSGRAAESWVSSFGVSYDGELGLSAADATSSGIVAEISFLLEAPGRAGVFWFDFLDRTGKRCTTVWVRSLARGGREETRDPRLGPSVDPAHWGALPPVRL